jgi:hypothetical protein
MRLRSIPGTIVVSGLVIGYIAWLEARNAVIRTTRRLKKIGGQR